MDRWSVQKMKKGFYAIYEPKLQRQYIKPSIHTFAFYLSETSSLRQTAVVITLVQWCVLQLKMVIVVQEVKDAAEG